MFDFYLGVENRWIAVRVAACDPLRKAKFLHSAATTRCIYASLPDPLPLLEGLGRKTMGQLR